MKNYTKKPITIQAFQFTGSNSAEINQWANSQFKTTEAGLIIPTLEGDHTATPGDYIIQGIKGEYYPCKPDIFEASYSDEGASNATQLISDLNSQIKGNPALVEFVGDFIEAMCIGAIKGDNREPAVYYPSRNTAAIEAAKAVGFKVHKAPDGMEFDTVMITL